MTLDDKFEALGRLGAGDFGHFNGSLREHLMGTRDRLISYGADAVLCDAGLFHAAYGTAGFAANMVSLDQRSAIADIIGAEAEAQVYLYCACDRDYFWPKIGIEEPLMFRDRFTSEMFEISDEQLCAFCELTIANENDISSQNAEFMAEWGAHHGALFARMEPWVSDAATVDSRGLYGTGPA
ncbi:MAG: DUF6817 domain-containing protein [Alphaproteobacteria bacterium]